MMRHKAPFTTVFKVTPWGWAENAFTGTDKAGQATFSCLLACLCSFCIHSPDVTTALQETLRICKRPGYWNKTRHFWLWQFSRAPWCNSRILTPKKTCAWRKHHEKQEAFYRGVILLCPGEHHLRMLRCPVT